jgi:hypothetical protein
MDKTNEKIRVMLRIDDKGFTVDVFVVSHFLDYQKISTGRKVLVREG